MNMRPNKHEYEYVFPVGMGGHVFIAPLFGIIRNDTYS